MAVQGGERAMVADSSEDHGTHKMASRDQHARLFQMIEADSNGSHESPRLWQFARNPERRFNESSQSDTYVRVSAFS